MVRNSSPLATPVFIGVSADLVKSEEEKEEWRFYKKTPDVSFCAWQWQVIAMVRGNVVP